MTRANNFRTTTVQKSLQSRGGRSLARLLRIFFKFYVFRLFRCIFRMAKVTSFKFGTVIGQVSIVLTRKRKFVSKRGVA